MPNPLLDRIQPQDAVLLVVDLQDRLLPAMHGGDAIVAAAGRIIRAMKVLEVPVIATEQYPAGLGRTCGVIRDAIADETCTPIEKMRFTACVEQTMNALESLNRRTIIVVGIEAHVCLQQTVLDLLRSGYRAIVCADAVTSRQPIDRDVALSRMRDAGGMITTTESILFEMLDRAGTDQFKQILKIVK